MESATNGRRRLVPVDRRLLVPRAAFAAWTLVLLGLLFLGGPVEDAKGSTPSGVAIVGAVVIVLVASVPWASLPAGSTAAIPLVCIALLLPLQVRSFATWDRDYALIILLPLVWLALRHGRSALVAGLTLATAVLWAPVVSDQEHLLEVITLACVYTGLAAMVGILVQALRDRTRAEAAVAALIHTDPLTELPNRRAWDEMLPARLSELDEQRGTACLAVLDIDGFKAYNDDWGHLAGDRLLADCARSWSAAIDGAYLARLGGDEFALLIPGATTEQVSRLVGRLREAVPPPTGLSAGIASWRPGETATAVLDRADRTLYAAKRLRDGSGATMIDSAVSGAAPDPHWNQLVPLLIDRREIVAAFQPIVDLDSREVIAQEALARPVGEAADLGVEEMFRAAHRLGLAGELDALCQEAAVRDARALPESQLLFINVGVGVLVDPGTSCAHLLETLHRARRDARSVILEISESINRLGRFTEALRLYRDAGFRFALDDVGEGHSTLEALAAVDPEYIKIARSLTATATTRGGAGTVSALVAFADTRGSAVVAEGIENDAEQRRMRELGVRLGQGYALGRPARLATPPTCALAAAS